MGFEPTNSYETRPSTWHLRPGWATFAAVDKYLNPPGGQMIFFLSTDSAQKSKRVDIKKRNGSAIKIDVLKNGGLLYFYNGRFSNVFGNFRVFLINDAEIT